MNREMERGWKWPPTPQGFATSMDSKIVHCTARDPCPEQKAQGRAQGSSVTCACSSQHSRAQIREEGALTQRMELLGCVQGGDPKRRARRCLQGPSADG